MQLRCRPGSSALGFMGVFSGGGGGGGGSGEVQQFQDLWFRGARFRGSRVEGL